MRGLILAKYRSHWSIFSIEDYFYFESFNWADLLQTRVSAQNFQVKTFFSKINIIFRVEKQIYRTCLKGRLQK